jgi:DNA modification methylase
MSEKPINMLTKFMEMFVDENTTMLDPTCGSGNAVRAAQNRGAASVLGLEKIEEFYTAAKGAYYNDDL